MNRIVLLTVSAALLLATGCGDDDTPSSAVADFTPGAVEPSIAAHCGLVGYDTASQQLGQGGDPAEVERSRQEARENVDKIIALVRDDPDAALVDDEKDRTVKEFAVDQVSELEADGCDEELAERLQRAVDAA